MKKRQFIPRLFSFLLAVVMIFSFAACAKNNPEKDNPDDSAVNPEKPDDSKDQGNPDNDSDKGDEDMKPDDNKDPAVKPDEKPKDDFYTLTEKENIHGDKSSIPDFTDAEKANQKAKGKALMATLQKEAADLSKSEFTIPKGDYGFDMDFHDGSIYSGVIGFLLRDINRPDDNPFTIHADNVTFWIEPSGYAFPTKGTIAFEIFNCSNISIVNLTLDEYTPNDVEGTVTKIDRNNNRIAIKLTNSSKPINSKEDAEKIVSGPQCRIIPFKANGDSLNAIYRIIPTASGPQQMYVKNIESTGNDNEFWLTFKTDAIIKAINSASWQAAYGNKGIFEKGDFITIVFGNNNIQLDACKQIKMIGLKSHLSKCMPRETGGYGAHLWKDCYFGPRKGSSKLLFGCEWLLRATRHGTTFDNMTMLSSSDDQFNVHGMWPMLTKINGKNATVKNLANGAKKGDIIEFYTDAGKPVGSLTIAEDVSIGNIDAQRQVVFTEEIPEEYMNLHGRALSQECQDWTVKNCNLFNNYQSILPRVGNGTFENNKIYNMGGTVGFKCFFGPVGGIIGNITMKDNVFYHSAISPESCMFEVFNRLEKKGGTVDLRNNLFVNCGKLLSAMNVEKINFKNNTVIEPIIYKGKCENIESLMLDFRNVTAKDISENDFYSTSCENSDRSINSTSKIDSELLKKINFYIENSDKDAKEIIEVIKNNLK